MTDSMLFHREVRIVPFQKEWATRFYWLKQLILGILCSEEIDSYIYHVGGTAIPGMCSKPIVDILVTVDRKNLLRAKDLLEQCFKSLGECGRPGRFFFSDGNNEHDAAYIHLTTADHQVAIEQKAFLSLLLASEALQQEYAELKMRLSEKYPMDRFGYRMEKGVFIQNSLSKHSGVNNNG